MKSLAKNYSKQVFLLVLVFSLIIPCSVFATDTDFFILNQRKKGKKISPVKTEEHVSYKEGIIDDGFNPNSDPIAGVGNSFQRITDLELYKKVMGWASGYGVDASRLTNSRLAVLNAAYSLLGIPYETPGDRNFSKDRTPTAMDCSGYVYWSYLKAGMNMTDFPAATSGYAGSPAFKRIPWGSLCPGDALVRRDSDGSGHVMIYLGTIGGVVYVMEEPRSGLSCRIATRALTSCYTGDDVGQTPTGLFCAYQYQRFPSDKPITSIINPASVSSNDAVAYFIQTYRQHGITFEGLCGILGNLQQESGVSPGSVGSSYRGMCQWSGTRWSRLESFCAQRGYDPGSVIGQVEYTWYELETYYNSCYQALKTITDPVLAACRFCKDFEGCVASPGKASYGDPNCEFEGKYWQELNKRKSYAAGFYERFR